MSLVPLTPWLAHRPRRGTTVIDTVVLHSCDHQNIDDLVQELRATDHSYHYILERDGTIVKGVPFSAIAFHCGNSYGPHEATRGISAERDGAGSFVLHPCVNEYTVGVCLMSPAGRAPNALRPRDARPEARRRGAAARGSGQETCGPS